jgi:signal transduction histidine kinase/CheY-like chemotaxis protein
MLPMLWPLPFAMPSIGAVRDCQPSLFNSQLTLFLHLRFNKEIMIDHHYLLLGWGLTTLVTMGVIFWFRRRQRRLQNDKSVLEGECEALADRLWALSHLEEPGSSGLSAVEAHQGTSAVSAGLIHEMRTPLNGILGLTRLLLDSDLRADQKHYAELAHRSGQSLLDLVNDLLLVSTMEAQGLTLEDQEIHLESLVEEICELLAQKAHDKALSLTCLIEPDCPARFMGDEQKLKQVLINLINNAIKFTDQGGVNVRVSCLVPEDESDDQEPMLRFAVEDTGRGISQADQQKIFQPFHHSRQQSGEGTGLGLHVSERLVRALGSRGMSVQSEENRGTVFSFSLLARQAGPVTEPLNLKGRTVTILSAFTFEATILAEKLQTMQADVQLFETLESFFLHEKTECFTDILLDNGLLEDPRKDMQFLADLAPKARIVALLTALERVSPAAGSGRYRDRVEELQQAGCHGYLMRPVRRRSLEKIMSGTHQGDNFANDPQSPDYNIATSEASFTILLAEDNPINALVIKAMLKRMGHYVDLAENGQKAWSLWCSQEERQCHYDFVFLDLIMPEWDGYETLRHMQMSYLPDPFPVPVLALTASEERKERSNALKAGFSGFIPKPVSPEDLQKIFEEFRTNDAALSSVADKIA